MAATIIACFALVVSIVGFLYPIILRFWIERPKLEISLSNVNFKDTCSKKQDKMTAIYEDMKNAERELREYETEKGY